MKKLTLLIVLITSMSYAQITDETGATLLIGNIGIGMTPTTTSDYKLEVNGGGKFMNKLLIENEVFDSKFVLFTSPYINLQSLHFRDNNDFIRFRAWSSYNASQIELNGISGNRLFTINNGNLGANNVFLEMPEDDSRIVIGGNGNYLLQHKLVVKNGSALVEGDILTNSNIGIGTSSFVDGADTYKLSVEGKVRAHAVKVYTSWADYVFEDNYNLPTLKEVEAYIQENGHLKDIPSAEEVEESGIELGEMNKLLLQKIEELTLYTIQLKKEIDQLQSKKQ